MRTDVALLHVTTYVTHQALPVFTAYIIPCVTADLEISWKLMVFYLWTIVIAMWLPAWSHDMLSWEDIGTWQCSHFMYCSWKIFSRGNLWRYNWPWNILVYAQWYKEVFVNNCDCNVVACIKPFLHKGRWYSFLGEDIGTWQCSHYMHCSWKKFSRGNLWLLVLCHIGAS